MTVGRFHRFEDRDALVDALCETCADAVEAALKARRTARLALSGGSTPEALYRALAEQDIDWGHVDVALVDERWVSPGDAASNERLVRESFSQALDAGARMTFMKTKDASPTAAAAAVDARYQLLRPFDLVVLGMGDDGHTASWFPHAEGLEEALDPSDGRAVSAIRAPSKSRAAPHLERMTLTRPVVAEAGSVVLMITGDGKRDAFKRASAPGPEADAPVRALLHRSDALVDVYWAP